MDSEISRHDRLWPAVSVWRVLRKQWVVSDWPGGCVRPPSASYKGLLLSLPASAVCDGDTSIRLLTSSKYLLDLARLSLTATTTVVMVSALLYSGGVGNIT